MAQVLVITIQFIANNPSGTFVTGDVLTIFYDNDLQPTPVNFGTAPIIVKKNGSAIISGPLIPNAFDSNGIYTSNFVGYSVCVSTSKVTPVGNLFGSFPYYYTYVQPNHQDCAVSPVVCDLTVTDLPTVVPASGAENNDGEIHITGESSVDIQYSIQADFLFGESSAQSTGDFTGLYPGDYRIFLRDENQCSFNILVTVGIDNTYGTLAQLEYTDLSGFGTKLEIKKRTYSGSVNELIYGTGEPFELSLRGEGGNDKFTPILSTQAKFNLIAIEDSQWHLFFTNNPNELQIVYNKDFGSGYEIIWTGFVLPNQYEETYKHVPHPVSVTATDNLPILKEIYFSNDAGTKITGTATLTQLISFCLKKTGLNLPIRVGINLYANSMDQDDSDDPLNQVYAELEAFYLADSLPTLDFVLRTILEPFGAQLILFNNRWNILRVEEMYNSYDWREFDADGNYSSNGSTDPIIDIDNPQNTNRLAWCNSDQHTELIPGYGSVVINYHLGLKDNILANGNFSLTAQFLPLQNVTSLNINKSGFVIVKPYALSESYEAIDKDNVAIVITGGSDTTGDAYVRSVNYSFKMGANNTLKISVRVKIDPPWNGLNYFTVPYQKIRIQVRYGTYYLKADGTWSTDSTQKINFYTTEFGKYVDYELTAIQPDVGVSTTAASCRVDLYHSFVYHADYLTFDGSYLSLKGVTTVGVPLGTKADVKDTSVAFATRINYYELVQSTDSESLPSLVRPSDYHASTNPVQWERKATAFVYLSTNFTARMYIDKIQVQYLINGQTAPDKITLSVNGQSKNKIVFEKDLYLGSYKEQFKTLPSFGFGSGVLGIPGSGSGSLSLINVSNLAANITYAGWMRATDGITPITIWKRDGIGEGRTLQEILLYQITGQYNKTIIKMTGSLSGIKGNVFGGFINTYKDVFDGGRLYRPVGFTISDRSAQYSAEFIELIDITETGGAIPFNSGFTSGFGSSSFN